jgi:PleD family two-component response regulator
MELHRIAYPRTKTQRACKNNQTIIPTHMARILVVDDERSIRNTVKEVLEHEKHIVELAENAIQAF